MSIQTQYQGFCNTPSIFTPKAQVPFEIKSPLPSTSNSFPLAIPSKMRLGNRVEQFVFFQLAENNYNLLSTNLQIIIDGRTLGELDCITQKDELIEHIEIVYKFYLYDSTVGSSELEHWIGPNRKDSLIDKLFKLENKQLPLLQLSPTKNLLKRQGLTKELITQSVLFKAQLFIPLDSKEIQFNRINKKCISGSFINIKNLHLLSKCYFYLPIKVEWLSDVNNNVKWMNYDDFKNELVKLISNHKSPLCWVKNYDGGLKKMFITWW